MSVLLIMISVVNFSGITCCRIGDNFLFDFFVILMIFLFVLVNFCY